jgi:hypothetical protein
LTLEQGRRWTVIVALVTMALIAVLSFAAGR